MALNCISICLNVDQAIKLFGAIVVKLFYFNVPPSTELLFHTLSGFVIEASLLFAYHYIMVDLLATCVINSTELVVLMRLIFK